MRFSFSHLTILELTSEILLWPTKLLIRNKAQIQSQDSHTVVNIRIHLTRGNLIFTNVREYVNHVPMQKQSVYLGKAPII